VGSGNYLWKDQDRNIWVKQSTLRGTYPIVLGLFWCVPYLSRYHLGGFLVSTPEHHVRYARAWKLYVDETNTVETRRLLEIETDSAQEDFSFIEFQQFKQTLPGYVEYWANLLGDA
jgi:hypothetical protein